jgi:hypothetical protein
MVIESTGMIAVRLEHATPQPPDSNPMTQPPPIGAE